MSNVIQLFPSANVPTGLRNIIKLLEKGDYEDDQCTLIIGPDVFHLGCVDDDEAATNAIFNMTMGIHKLMDAVSRGQE